MCSAFNSAFDTTASFDPLAMNTKHPRKLHDECGTHDCYRDYTLRGFAKLKKIQKIQKKIWMDLTPLTHPPTPIQTFFWKPITDVDRAPKS